MGRTVVPAMMVQEQEAERWSKFRRALRREDQIIVDELFLLARKHVQAASYASDPLPFETLMLSMLIELQKQIHVLEHRRMAV